LLALFSGDIVRSDGKHAAPYLEGQKTTTPGVVGSSSESPRQGAAAISDAA
jgi:hypothetical protein